MKKNSMSTNVKCKNKLTRLLFLIFLILIYSQSYGQIKLEKEVKITDQALHFNGKKVSRNSPNNGPAYDYFFGSRISAHGDCIKKFKNFIFTTWYKGGKHNRRVMLSRYNTKTGKIKTIEFPHRHTGLNGNWWIGESHNTIAVGISPKDGTIHMLYDMHSYSNGGAFKNDYFRYAYSKKNAATVSDANFKLNLFVKDGANDYTHVSLNGSPDPQQFQDLTYPKFFLNDNGDLLMHMRRGGNDNGAYVFSKYTASTSKWSKLQQFNKLNAKKHGQPYNWGLYGSMKYVNGKLRVGFQRRSGNKNDKYEYQNGFYYGYSDDQTGKSKWKDHKGKSVNIPFANADLLKVSEPGNLVSATGKNEVSIVQGFDWTVTARGDVHIIGKVKDKKNNVIKNVHTYKPVGKPNFITSTDFSGADQLYTYKNDIYIIGLEKDRIYVEKATGGKNNFKRVYSPKTGKKFRHGVPYIVDGKLYYYMMEKKSGDKQPLYLQIIDLDLQEGDEDNRPIVSITNPSRNNQEFTLGKTITLKANATDPDSNLDYVNFKINGTFFKQDRNRPFAVSWKPSKPGVYTIGVRAFDKKGLYREVSRKVIITGRGDINSTCSFKMSIDKGLGAMDKVTYSNVHVLGDNGPKLGNFRKFTINWVPDSNGLYQFAINTNNGSPDWYVDFKDSMGFQLQNSNPEVTLRNTGFDGLDGAYWVARDGENLALVSKSGNYTIYFSNSATAPNCDRLNPETNFIKIKAFPNPVLDSYLSVTGMMSEELKTLQIISVDGRVVKEITTKNEAETIDVSELPSGSYFLVVKSVRFKESILVVKK
ncbi:BNR-4 repeat-containing protein [uncultured Aquimarina sp.]|uniref:BNR-4 repeat-containing protein n=1 Tax=uncultured Aquimarina sp. TaxID=575652 RepID=UPI00261363E9|nr:BNR-4 repeat-containing protein [uncultured Aquimarina sp.]